MWFQEQVSKNRFPSKGSRNRFASKISTNRFPSKVPKKGFQARLPGIGSQARFPRTGSQEQVSKNRLPRKGSQAKLPGTDLQARCPGTGFQAKFILFQWWHAHYSSFVWATAVCSNARIWKLRKRELQITSWTAELTGSTIKGWAQQALKHDCDKHLVTVSFGCCCWGIFFGLIICVYVCTCMYIYIYLYSIPI